MLVQLPMYNEEAHCALIIQRCCKIVWPKERLLIQVSVGWCRADGNKVMQRWVPTSKTTLWNSMGIP